MDVVVSSVAAKSLGVDPSRVRQLIHAGQLRGERAGRDWLVNADDVAERAARAPLPRRPLAPARAWGLLDLLEGGGAPWLAPVARSQVRQVLRSLSGADARRWQAALRARAERLPLHVHPSALQRIAGHPDVLAAGPERAIAVGMDLVALNNPAEIYLSASDWSELASRYRLPVQPAGSGEQVNLVAHVPKGVWPFHSHEVGPAALAADLLDSPEPRARAAGLEHLNGLASGLPTSSRKRVR